MTVFRVLLVGLIAAVAALSPFPADAQSRALDYQILIDNDQNALTGCSVTPTGSAGIAGFEHRLRVRVEVDSSTAEVTGVGRETCNGTGFSAALSVTQPISPPWPLGLNGGIDGTDAIELAVPQSDITSGPTSALRLAFVADDGNGSDVLDTDNGTANGGPITVALPFDSIPVPLLSVGGLAILLLAMLAIGVLMHRKLGRIGALSAVLLVASVAWAMNFMLDGLLGDWNGIPPIGQDPSGDPTDGNAGNDLVASFAGFENGNLYLRLDVANVENGAPAAAPDDYAVDEDGALNIAAPGVLANDTDADALSAVLDSGPASAASFTLNADGSFDYTPNADFNGGDSFSYFANDGTLESIATTVTITVNPVNDAPSFTPGGDVSSNEDAGAQTVGNWATDISAGPADESGQVLSFNITGNTNAALFAAGPAVDASGTLTYTAAADASGSASITIALSDDGGTDNGGTDTSPTTTFTITVNPVNDAPTFTASDPAAVPESAGAQTINGWALFNAGPTDEATQSVAAYSVTNISNPTLFAAAPSVDASGNLSYAPAAGASGSSTFEVTVQDDGGTANGGVDTSAPQTFTISVNEVNDAPSFTPGGDVSSNEDAGAQTVGNWATDISAGPADESSQVLSFNITGNTNAALFAAGPAVDASGTLTYTAAADASGSASITIALSDDGGTDNGGTDTSPTTTLTITVNPVNDAPGFTASDPAATLEDAGAQTVNGWAAFSAGAADESGQSVVGYSVSNLSNPALFISLPTVDVAGNLSYTAAANASGTSSFDVTVQDSGGTANGGIDTSSPQTFTVTVTPVNDAPSFTSGGNVSSNEDTGAQSVAGWATNISPGPANESGQSLNFNITGNTNTALFSAGPAIDPATGNLTYTAAANANGSATISLTLSDDGGTANSGDDTSATTTFTVTVIAIDDPPSAVDDTATVSEDATATAIDVLANDFDIDGGTTISISSLTQPTNGTVAITGGGTGLTYAPDTNYCNDGTTTDDFTYSLSSGSSATVAMRVNCVNDAPVADDEVVTAACNILGVVEAAAGETADAGAAQVFRTVTDNVLLGDSDPVEGTAVNIVQASGLPGGTTDATAPFSITTTQGGTATLYVDGSFIYTPEAGDRSVADSFTYTIEDADGGQDTATVTLNVGPTCVWFVDNSVSASDDVGTGTSSDPFTSLVDEIGPDTNPDDAEDASIAGDVIYVFEGDSNTGDAYQGGFVAKANQTILGEGFDLVVDLGGGPETLFVASTDNPPLVSSSTGDTFSVVAVTGVEIAGFNVASSGDNGIGITAIIGPVGAFVHDNAIASTANEAVSIGQTNAGTSTVTLIGNTLSSTVSDGLRVDVSAGTLELAVDNNTNVIGATQGFNISGAGGTLYLTSFCGNSISGDTGGTGVSVASVVFDANPGDLDFTDDEVECTTGLTIGDPANRLDFGSGLVLTAVTGDLDLGALNIRVGSAGGGDEVALRVTAADPFNAATGTGFQFTTDSGTVDSIDGPAVDMDPVDLENMVLTTVISQNSDSVGVGLDQVSGSFITNGGNSSITGVASNAFAIVNTPAAGLTVTYDGDITNTSAAALLVDGHPAGTVTFSGGTLSDTGGTGLQFDNADGTYSIQSTATLNGGDAGVDIVNGSGGSFTFADTDITSPTGPGIRVADSAPSTVTFSNASSLTYTMGQPAVLLQNRGAGVFTHSGTVNASGGTGLQFNNDDGSQTNFNGAVTLNGGDAGIDIVGGSSSAYTFSNTAVTSPTGVAFNVDSSSGGVTWSTGGITQTNAASAVRINNHSSGIVDLFAPIVGNTMSANAIDLTGVNGGIYNFRGGLDLDTTTGIAFNADDGTVNVCGDSACNGSGTALSNTVDVTGAAPAGVDIVNTGIGTSGVTFNTVNVNGAADGIRLTNVGSGTFTALGGTIQNVTDRGVDVSGGSGSIRVDASIDTTTTGRSVEVTTHNGGTVAFNGFIDDDGLGIRMENNVGSILRFAGGMDVDTANAVTDEGFQVTGAGTLNVCADTNCDGTGAGVTNDVNTSLGTGIAVNIAGGTTIGSDGVTFQSVSANGALNGIVLNSTGTTGFFSVTGDGSTAGSGGTVQNISVNGIELRDTQNVSLAYMSLINANTTDNCGIEAYNETGSENCHGAIYMNNVMLPTFNNISINGTAEQGIVGVDVTGLRLLDSSISNAGNSPSESGINIRDLLGTAGNSTANIISGTTITNSAEVGVFIRNLKRTNAHSGEADRLELTNSVITQSGNSTAADNVTISLRDDASNNGANLQVIVSGTTLSGVTGEITDAIQFDSGLNAKGDFQISTTSIDDANTGINISGTDNSQTTFLVNNNTSINVNNGQGVNVAVNGTATMSGTISNNTIDSFSADIPGFGIDATVDATGSLTIDVNSNTVTDFSIPVRAGARNSGTGTANVTVRNNTMSSGGGFAFGVLRVYSGNGAGAESNAVCANITGNNFNDPSGAEEYYIEQYSGNSLNLQGYTGSASSAATIQSFIETNNFAGDALVETFGTIINIGNATCALP